MTAQLPSSSGNVATPVQFGINGRQCTGFHHTPTGMTRSTAILVCPSWGSEFMRGYRGVRMLATTLASRGFETLRFDYSGTGDAHGNALDARLEHWLEDIREAVRELRDLSGNDQVAIVGIRFGALLAEAATRDRGGIRLRAYWDAPVNGADYIKRVQEHGDGIDFSRQWRRRRDMQLPPHDAHELFGHAWPQALAEAVPALTVPLDDPDRLWVTSSDMPVPHGVPADQVLDVGDNSHWHQVEWTFTGWNPVSGANQLADFLSKQLS